MHITNYMPSFVSKKHKKNKKLTTYFVAVECLDSGACLNTFLDYMAIAWAACKIFDTCKNTPIPDYQCI